MPKAKKPAPIKPVAPTPPAAPANVVAPPPTGLPVLYPVLEIEEYSTTSAKGPLDIAWQKDVMWWETEKQYQKRMVAEEFAKGNTTAKAEHFLFGDGVRKPDGRFQPVHCRDLSGQKIICWNNANNRPFDEKWCESLIHTILYGQWAGPFTIPGETVNGETIRISRYGRVLSGQHQMTACILAGEWLAKARADGVDDPSEPRYPVWAKHGEPFIESVVIRGLSEDPRVLMTIDYVKPRSAADVFYTSATFRGASPPDRKELCRMLASAVDLLWTRTDTKGYRTHPEIVAFLDRHPRLVECCTHLFAENCESAKRKINKLRLGAGNCAALMFLQGSAGPKTDGDEYRNENPPTEKHLDWSLWDAAGEFWTLLAGGADFELVREALGTLVASRTDSEDNQGMGGRWPEKVALLAKAWERWRDDDPPSPVFCTEDFGPGGNMCLSYSNLDDKSKPLPNGEIKLLDVADFYGIDCPESTGKGSTSKAPPMPPPPKEDDIWYGPNAKGSTIPPPPGEVERLKREAEARRGQAAGKK